VQLTKTDLWWKVVAVFLAEAPAYKAKLIVNVGEVRSAWTYNPTVLYVAMVWYLIRHTGNFTYVYIMNTDINVVD
jgi:hypothetical protein